MSHPPKSGDRVRITSANRMLEYQAGAVGTVLWGPILGTASAPYYVLLMDSHAGGGPAIFMAEEVEPVE